MNKSQLAQPDYTFFLDENMGANKVSAAMKAAGIKVEICRDHFPPGTADEELLAQIGQRGWILITQDTAIRYRKSEQIALRENLVRAFFVTCKGMRGEEIGALIVSAMPKIFRILKKTNPPLIALISRNKVLELKEGKKRKRN